MKKFDNYPFYIPFLRNLFNLSLFSLGVLILSELHTALAVLYALYCLFAALVIMPKLRCTRCFYHGRRCSTGFGLVAGCLYKKDETKTFTDGLWHNIFLLPIGLIPLAGALWRIFSLGDKRSIWLGFSTILVLAGLLTEHANLGCRACHELLGCPAGFAVNGGISEEPQVVGEETTTDAEPVTDTGKEPIT